MNPIISRFCPRTEFDSYEDFYENYRCIVPPDFNFAFDVADRWAEIDPDKLALKWTDDSGVIETFTFGSLKASSGQAANALLRLGIQKGDTVMLILKQRPAVWTLLLALEKIGAVAIPASYQLTEKDIAYRCTAAGVKLLVVVDEPGIVETALAARPGCPPGMALAVCGAASRSEAFGFPPGCIDILAEIAAASPDFPRPAGGRTEDPMLIYFSSGTTGMPKMVLHNHSLPLGHIVTAKYWQCVEEGGVHLTQTDSGWAKFAWGKIYGQWICGAAVAVYDTEKFTPDGMLDALDRLRPATFCAPATIFRFLIKEDLSGRDFSYIRHTSVAGEPLSPEVYHKIRSMMGLEIREGFGQSEGSVLLANFRWFPVRPGAMGKPAPLFGIALLGEDGAPCDDGIVGTISVTNAGEPATLTTPPPRCQAPGLFTGYWKDDGITAACWHDGTYRTGDMAWRDGDGYYWFVGRNDDVIKCSGYRIGPFEVESALMEHPSVLECAVTAAPDPMRGQVVKATVVLARGFAPSAGLVRELQNHVKRVTAPYKYPRIVEFAAELPKTSSGKIQRNIIRERDAGSN
jgi:acetyl-CoA synthetase